MTDTRPSLVRRRVSTAAAGLLLVVLASCTSTTAGSASPTTNTPTGSTTSASTGPTLPTRARTFDVSTLDPCTLLTAAQQATLGIDRPPQGPKANTPVPGSRQCGFIVTNPTTGYGVSTDTARNAAALADSALSTTVETIGGVGAVVVDGNGVGCSYVLDTSDTTNIFIGSTSQNSSAAIDCPKAKAVAEAIVATLTALQPG